MPWSLSPDSTGVNLFGCEQQISGRKFCCLRNASSPKTGRPFIFVVEAGKQIKLFGSIAAETDSSINSLPRYGISSPTRECIKNPPKPILLKSEICSRMRVFSGFPVHAQKGFPLYSLGGFRNSSISKLCSFLSPTSSTLSVDYLSE